MRASLTLFSVAALGSVANALPSTLMARDLPKVTVVERPRACASYPTYNPETGEASEFIFFPDSTEQPLPRYIGSTDGGLENPEDAPRRIGIAVRPDLAKRVSKCFPDGGEEGLRAWTGEWTRLTLGPGGGHTYILIGQGPVAHWPLTPHSHFFANGTQQVGTFMGFGGQTTWAFLRQPAQDGYPEQYRTRLLNSEAVPLEEGEFRGFLRAGFYDIDA